MGYLAILFQEQLMTMLAVVVLLFVAGALCLNLVFHLYAKKDVANQQFRSKASHLYTFLQRGHASFHPIKFFCPRLFSWLIGPKVVLPDISHICICNILSHRVFKTDKKVISNTLLSNRVNGAALLAGAVCIYLICGFTTHSTNTITNPAYLNFIFTSITLITSVVFTEFFFRYLTSALIAFLKAEATNIPSTASK